MALQATAAQKADYNERINPLKSTIKMLTDKLKKEEIEIKRMKQDDKSAYYQKIINYVKDLLQLCYLNVNISLISSETINIKNEGYLNDTRKYISQIMVHLELIIGHFVDSPLNENDEVFEVLNTIIDDKFRLEFIQSLGLIINRLEWLYGDNSKWKWSFVEIEGRFATAAKNITDFTNMIRQMDPSVPGYTLRMDILSLIKKMIDEAANRFRDKYEMVGKRPDDMKSALNFLALQKRLHLVLEEHEEAGECKKKFEFWKKKLEEDTKEKENKRK